MNLHQEKLYFLVEYQNKQGEHGNRRGKPKNGKTGRNPRSKWLPPTVKPRCRGIRVSVDHWTPKTVDKAFTLAWVLKVPRHEQALWCLCIYGEAPGALGGAKLVTSQVREWKGREGRLGFHSLLQVHVPKDKDVPQGHTLGFHHFLMAALWSPSVWCLAVHLCRVLLLPCRETVLRGFPLLLSLR